jgi:hypothetical protein
LFDANLSCRQQDLHFGKNAYRRDRDAFDLPPRRGRVADLRVEQGELPLLQLQGPLTGEEAIERLPHAAKGLLEKFRFLLQPFTMLAFHARQ